MVLAEQVLGAAEVALPGLRQAAELILPGTPVTFQRYTRRSAGWVGGFPTDVVVSRPGATIGALPLAGWRQYFSRAVHGCRGTRWDAGRSRDSR